MGDDEIKEISQAMVSLGTVSANVIERLIVDFAEKISSTGTVTGSYESTEKLLLKSLPKEKVDLILEELRGPAGRTIWDKLSNVNENTLATFLKNEYPQTAAVVLSKLKPEYAARVLAHFPESYTMEVIMRMLKLEHVARDTLEVVENTLKTEFMANLSRTTKTQPHEQMAEIFNNMDARVAERFLEGLGERDRSSEERIKDLMFTFSDLTYIDPSGIQLLFKEVDRKTLVLALKGAESLIMDMFLTNMSERAGRMLKEELQSIGAVKLKDVEEARKEIVEIAKRLAGQGLLVIGKGNSNDELIY